MASSILSTLEADRPIETGSMPSSSTQLFKKLFNKATEDHCFLERRFPSLNEEGAFEGWPRCKWFRTNTMALTPLFKAASRLPSREPELQASGNGRGIGNPAEKASVEPLKGFRLRLKSDLAKLPKLDVEDRTWRSTLWKSCLPTYAPAPAPGTRIEPCRLKETPLLSSPGTELSIVQESYAVSPSGESLSLPPPFPFGFGFGAFGGFGGSSGFFVGAFDNFFRASW